MPWVPVANCLAVAIRPRGDDSLMLDSKTTREQMYIGIIGRLRVEAQGEGKLQELEGIWGAKPRRTASLKQVAV